MKEDNTIQIISKAFALRIIKLYQYLQDEKHEFVISKQILKSGTSIGANARESINAESPQDFIHKLSIALKEANETQYWLELLYESNYISEAQFNSIYPECGRIVATLIRIIKTKKDNIE